MSHHQHRTPMRRALVVGTCLTALAIGPAAGLASADDASLAKTLTARALELQKREKTLDTAIASLKRAPTLKAAKTAQKSSAAIYTTIVTFRKEIQDDDGSSTTGSDVRDAVLDPLTTLGTKARTLDSTLRTTVKRKTVTKAQATKVVSAKLQYDKAVGAALTAITKALKS